MNSARIEFIRENLLGKFNTQHLPSLEQLKSEETKPYFDMWALGVLVFKMMVGEEPFPFMKD